MSQLFAFAALLALVLVFATTECRNTIEYENTLLSDARRTFAAWNITSIELESPKSVLVRSITIKTDLSDYLFRNSMFKIFSQVNMTLPESRMIGVESTCDWIRARNTVALFFAMLGAIAGWRIIDQFVSRREVGAVAGSEVGSEAGPELVKSD